MPDQESLSEFWRVRRSRDRAIELKILMEDLTSLVGSTIRQRGQRKNVKVLWSEEMEASCTVKDQDIGITIDTVPLRTSETPIPGDRVDVLSGLALHEAGHVLTKGLDNKQRDKAWRHIYEAMPSLGYTQAREASQRYLKAIEDCLLEIIVDQRIRKSSPAAAGYIASARRYYRQVLDDIIKGTVERCSEPGYSIEDVLNIWGWMSVYDEPLPQNLDAGLVPILIDLMDITSELLSRPSRMPQLVTKVWDKIGHLPFAQQKQQPEPQQQGNGDGDEDSGRERSQTAAEEQGESDEEQNTSSGDKTEEEEEEEELGPDSEEQEEAEQEGESADEDYASPAPDDGTKLISEVMRDRPGLSENETAQVLKAIELDREDITEQINISSGMSSATTILEKWPYDRATEAKLMSQGQSEANALANILQQWKRRRTKWVRGKENGIRIDHRLLYRGGYNDRHVFRDRELKNRLDMGLCLMIDESGSINPNQWEIMSHVCAAFASAIGHRSDIDLMILGYSTSSHAGISIRRIWDTAERCLRLSGEKLDGSTPSGYALAGIRDVVLSRFTKHQDRVIIHVTDGQPDEPELVTLEAQKARAKGIQVGCILVLPMMTVIDRYSTYLDTKLDEFRAAYGRAFRRIPDFKSLPGAIEEVMRDLLEKR